MWILPKTAVLYPHRKYFPPVVKYKIPWNSFFEVGTALL